MRHEIIQHTETALHAAFAAAIERAKTESDDPARIEQIILNLAATDMKFLELVADNSKLLLEHSETVFKLLAHGYVKAMAPEMRGKVRQLATRLGFGPRLQKLAHREDTFTESQKAALRTLHAVAELAEDSSHEHADTMRLMPLLVGPSGVGKSHVVRAFARQRACHYLRLCVGDWVVVGARTECTFQTILHLLEEHDSLVIHCDEIDKISQQAEPTAWGAAVLTELYSLLDRQVTYSGTTNLRWTAKHDVILKEKVIFVGSATFQSVWSSLGARKVGFTSPALAPDSIMAAARKAQIVPEELLTRFGDSWVVLAPYSVADFARMAKQRKISRRVLDPVKAAESGLNFRYLESAVTSDAVRKQIRLMAERSAQVPSSFGRTHSLYGE